MYHHAMRIIHTISQMPLINFQTYSADYHKYVAATVINDARSFAREKVFIHLSGIFYFRIILKTQ